MLKKTILSLICVFALKCSAECQEKPYDQAVSLGYSCQVVWQLETNGLRVLAYPFDWVHTPFSGLLSFLDNKGAGFLDLQKISIEGAYPGDPSHLKVVDLINGLISYHDFLSSPCFGNYIAIKDKYDRRTKRLFELLNSNKNVLLVRQGGTKAEIEHLDFILNHTYPNLTYTLLALNCTDEYQNDWSTERIKNYFIPEIPGDWMGNYARWKEVLSEFSVVPNTAARTPDEVW